MPKPKPNPTREHRIEEEIVVDAYNSDEKALSWYYYLQEKLVFPFNAKCVTPRATLPLKKGEKLEVLTLAPEDDCMGDMFVLVRVAGRKLGVPLAQLEVLEAKGNTREAVEDWQYWVAMGYEF